MLRSSLELSADVQHFRSLLGFVLLERRYEQFAGLKAVVQLPAPALQSLPLQDEIRDAEDFVRAWNWQESC